MKINELSITNFTKHRSFFKQFNKNLVFCYGKNASGKSSIRDAISFVFTGRTNKIGKEKGLVQELTTIGETNTIVSIKNDTFGSITRTIPNSFKIADRTGSNTTIEEGMYYDLAITKEQLICCIYGSEFFNMDSNAQKDFIFDMLNISFSKNNIQEQFNAWALENSYSQTVYDSIWDYLNSSAGLFNWESKDIFENISDHYAVENRTVKKQIKSLEEFLKNFKNVELPSNITPEKRDSVEKQLADLQNKKNELYKQIGKIDSANNRIKDLKAIIAKSDTLQETPQNADYYKGIIKNINRISEDAQKVRTETLVKKYADEHVLNSLKDFKGNCALSPNIKCPLTTENIKEIITDLEIKINTYNAQIDEIESGKKEIDTELKDTNELLEKRINYDKSIIEIQAAIKEYEDYKKYDINSDDINKEIQVIEERIVKGQNIKYLIDTYESNKNIEITSKEQLAQLKDINRNCEAIIQAFKPKGIKSNLLINLSRDFETRINNTLNLLTGGNYQVKFIITDDFDIMINHNNQLRNIRHLSSSERMRISIAIQVAISEIIGLKILIYDDLEILDLEGKKAFMQTINQIKSRFDFILCISTVNTPPSLSKEWDIIAL
jgi:DNA repair exonuclease SbcCD ATPase subunit